MKAYTFCLFDDQTIAVETFDTYHQARAHCWSVTSESQFIAIVGNDSILWFRKVARLTFAPKPQHLIPDAIVDRLEDVMLALLNDELNAIVDEFSSAA